VSLQDPPLQSSSKVHDYGSGFYSLELAATLDPATTSLGLAPTLELVTTSLELATTSLELATTSLKLDTTPLELVTTSLELATTTLELDEIGALKFSKRPINVFLAFVRFRPADT
jgi:hypothetical protein